MSMSYHHVQLAYVYMSYDHVRLAFFYGLVSQTQIKPGHGLNRILNGESSLK